MDTSGYVVREAAVTARPVAGVRAQVPAGHVASAWKRSLDLVYAAARTGAVQLDGQNVFIYRGLADGVLTVDFCVGVTAPFTAIGEVQPLTTPGGRALVTTHAGDYGGLAAASDAVRAWARDRGLRLAGPSWEVYGHWNADPSLLRTDVYWLLA